MEKSNQEITGINDSPAGGKIVALEVPKKRRSMKRWLLLAALSVIILVILLLGLGVAGVYWLGWQNQYSYGISRLVPLPVASFDSQRINYAEYYPMADFQYFSQPVNKGKKLSASQLHKAADQQAITVLSQLSFLNSYAQSHHISVSQQDIAKEAANITDKAPSALRSKYQADQPAVADQARLNVLEQKISASLSIGSKSQTEDALNHAKALKQQLGNQGLVSLYSKNVVSSPPASAPPTAHGLPADVQKATDSLPANVLSDPIVSSDGNIYLVEKVSSNGGQAQRYFLAVPTNAGFNINNWLTEQMKSHQVKVYLPQLNVITKNS